jgi:hypothetical protein
MVRSITLACLLVLCGCAALNAPQPITPRPARGLGRVILDDPSLGDITDIAVTGKGETREVIVAASRGTVILNNKLEVVEEHRFEARPFNPGLVDIDGDGTLELLERGNSIFMRPIAARRINGELLWSTNISLQPSDFAHLWACPVDRDQNGTLETIVGVKGVAQACVLSSSGQELDRIPWDRVNCSDEIVHVDVNDDGVKDFVFGSGPELVARDAYGRELFREKLPGHPGWISTVRLMMPCENGGHRVHALQFTRRERPGLFARDDTVRHDYVVSFSRGVPAIEEVPANSQLPLAALVAMSSDAVVAVTSHAGLGHLFVSFKQPGKLPREVYYFAMGGGPCQNAVEPGDTCVVSPAGSESDIILVGQGNALWALPASSLTQ